MISILLHGNTIALTYISPDLAQNLLSDRVTGAVTLISFLSVLSFLY
jgi:hypothetical protein